MKIFFLLILLVLNIYALRITDIRHLSNRVLFSDFSSKTIQPFKSLTRGQAIDFILNNDTKRVSLLPSWYGKLTPSEERKDKQNRRVYDFEMKKYWLEEMINSKNIFAEYMTLFWHNHFTSSNAKVRSCNLMLKQNILFRDYCLGNFKEFVKKVSADPAMLIYLDVNRNNKENPNENYARELLELFTLGEGHYLEEDIKQAAKVFTGIAIDMRSTEARKYIIAKIKDNSEKFFLGEAVFTVDDVVEVIFRQKEIGCFIVKKMWQTFISQEPKEEDIKLLVNIFIDNDFEIKPLLKGILTHKAFWDIKNRNNKIKSPVELMVGTYRNLGKKQITKKEINLLKQMKQDLFNHYSVAGWGQDKYWISTNTLIVRKKFCGKIRDHILRNKNSLPIYRRFVEDILEDSYQLK